MDRLKLWERTLVVFIGDNGYHHNERNWWNKNTLFERSCLVPMIVCAPDARAGSTAAGLVEMVDLYPTIADYCGVAVPHEPAGRSLRPLLKRPDGPGKPAAFTFVSRGGGAYGQSARTDRWRYTLWSDGGDELYDHAADPEETRDVSGLPGNETIVRRHRELIGALGPYVPARSK
jgi:arylsulfatase A-like enzyme